MPIDDSFKQPGSVPFKWEIRPGVPKIHHTHHHQKLQLSPPTLPSPSPPFTPRRHLQSPTTTTTPPQQQKLKPPPGGFIFIPPPEPRTRSFRSAPRTRSERWRFEQPTRVRPECVSPGCFPSSPLLVLKRKDSKRKTTQLPKSEPDYSCELETVSRWSVSSRKSLSPFRYSSGSSSFSSYQSSPRVPSESEWAGFGLF